MTDGTTTIGVGFSDQTILIVSITGFAIVAATVYTFLYRRSSHHDDGREGGIVAGGIGGGGGGGGHSDTYEEQLLRNVDPSQLTRAQRRARAHLVMKQTRRYRPTTNTDRGAAAVRDDDDDTIDREIDVILDGRVIRQQQQQQQEQSQSAIPQSSITSREERKRLAKATEKHERRLFEEERQRVQREAQEQAMRERQIRLAKQARKAQTEQEQKKFQREQEELKKQMEWETFLSNDEKSLSVAEWRTELQSYRFADLNRLALEFGTSVDNVRKRIDTLVAECRVAGIFEDDYFIYFTDAELHALAQQIKCMGMATTSQIAEYCTQTILSQPIVSSKVETQCKET